MTQPSEKTTEKTTTFTEIQSERIEIHQPSILTQISSHMFVNNVHFYAVPCLSKIFVSLVDDSFGETRLNHRHRQAHIRAWNKSNNDTSYRSHRCLCLPFGWGYLDLCTNLTHIMWVVLQRLASKCLSGLLQFQGGFLGWFSVGNLVKYAPFFQTICYFLYSNECVEEE